MARPISCPTSVNSVSASIEVALNQYVRVSSLNTNMPYACARKDTHAGLSHCMHLVQVLPTKRRPW